MVKKSYKLQVKRKGKVTIRVRVPPPTSGSQILHLRICPELLKSCICDPENLGGGSNTKLGWTYHFTWRYQVKEKNWGPPSFFNFFNFLFVYVMSNYISMSPSSRKSHMGKQDLNFGKATCQQRGYY